MPLSSDPEKRARQQANLRRGLSDNPAKRARQLENLTPAPPAPPGNQRRLMHGGRSELLLRDVEAEVAELAAALGESAPVRESDGSLPLADVIAVESAARALRRYRSVTAWCDAHGRITEKGGEVKPAADLEIKAERQLNEALDRLGMNPMARSRLGLNLARSAQVDLARLWAAEADAEAIEGTAVDEDGEAA